MGGEQSSPEAENIKTFVRMQGYTITLSNRQLLNIIKRFYKRILLGVLNGNSEQTYKPMKKDAMQKYLNSFQGNILNIVKSSIKNDKDEKGIISLSTFVKYAKNKKIGSLIEFSSELSLFVECIQSMIDKSHFILNEYLLGSELQFAYSRFERVVQEDLKGKVLTIFRLRDTPEKKPLLTYKNDLISMKNELLYEIFETNRQKDKKVTNIYGPYFKVAAGGSQSDIYKSIKSTLDLPQYHCILFGYGASGSGKTYTLFGSDENKGVVKQFFAGGGISDITTRIFTISLLQQGVEIGSKEGEIKVSYNISFQEYMQQTAGYVDMLHIENKSEAKTPKFTADRIDLAELLAKIKEGKNNNIIKWTPNNAKSTRGIVVFEYDFKRPGGERGVMTVIDLPGIENFSSEEINGYLKNSQGLDVKNELNGTVLTQTIFTEYPTVEQINKTSVLVAGGTRNVRTLLSARIYRQFEGKKTLFDRFGKEEKIPDSMYTFMNVETLLNLQAESAWINTFTSKGGVIAKFLKHRQMGMEDFKGLPYVKASSGLYTLVSAGETFQFTGYLKEREKLSGLKSKFIMVATAFNPSPLADSNVYINRIKSNGAVQTLEFSHKFASTSDVSGGNNRVSQSGAATAGMSELMKKILDVNTN